MVGREEGRRPGRVSVGACSGTELPESTRREDLLQTQQRPRTGAEQLLRPLDVVAGTDTAADVEKRDVSLPEAFGSLDEQRRRGVAALWQRDVEESVRDAACPTEKRHGDEPVVTERADQLHLGRWLPTPATSLPTGNSSELPRPAGRTRPRTRGRNGGAHRDPYTANPGCAIV